MRQKLMLALAGVTLLISATGCFPKSPPTLAPDASPARQSVPARCNTRGDSAEVKAFKQEADTLFNGIINSVWTANKTNPGSSYLWRNAWAMDTLLDYFAVCDVDASSFGETVLGALNPTAKVDSWWDDFGWVGIASLRAAEQNIDPARREDFLKVAINSWAYMYGPGWSKTNHATIPFTDVPGWQKFMTDHKTNVGALNVWNDIEQTWPAVTEDQKTQRQPRYSPGGAWNSTIVNGDTPILTPAYDGTGHYLNPIQNTVTNGLYAILTLRLYLASQNPAFKEVFSQSGLDADACLKAWKDQIGWLNQWLVATPDTDESWLLRTAAGSLVRERVSTFHDSNGVRYWDAGYVKDLAWTGDQGLLIGALREGQKAGYLLQQQPEVLGLYPYIIKGVFKNGYYSRTYGEVQGSFLLPWIVIGASNPYTTAAPGGRNNGADIDAGDYQTGNAVFMRYLLQAYKADPTLVKEYKDYILSSARNLVKFGDSPSVDPPGGCEAYILQLDSTDAGPMTMPVNQLSVLLLAIEMSD